MILLKYFVVKSQFTLEIGYENRWYIVFLFAFLLSRCFLLLILVKVSLSLKMSTFGRFLQDQHPFSSLAMQFFLHKDTTS